MIFEEEKQNENDDGDGADRDDLAIQVRLRTFLNRRGNFTHSFVAGRGADHYCDEQEGKN